MLGDSRIVEQTWRIDRSCQTSASTEATKALVCKVGNHRGNIGFAADDEDF